MDLFSTPPQNTHWHINADISLSLAAQIVHKPNILFWSDFCLLLLAAPPANEVKPEMNEPPKDESMPLDSPDKQTNTEKESGDEKPAVAKEPNQDSGANQKPKVIKQDSKIQETPETYRKDSKQASQRNSKIGNDEYREGPQPQGDVKYNPNVSGVVAVLSYILCRLIFVTMFQYD